MAIVDLAGLRYYQPMVAHGTCLCSRDYEFNAPAGNFIEVEGHTDSTGSTETNEQLGLARAENVKRYLYETYQIPLHKINVISYGESKPAAPNTSPTRTRGTWRA